MRQHQFLSTLSTIAVIVSGLWVGENVYAVTFSPPPGGGAPTQTTGGASRGTVNFQPPTGRGTPTQTTGGASRGTIFMPPVGSRSPRQGSVAGASRTGIFTPAAGRSSPQRTAGGASRQGDYAFNSLDGAAEHVTIVPLLPQTYTGTTISERPTFLVYLPASTATKMVFSLKDEAGKSHYQTTLPTSGRAGVVAIKLPDQAPTLTLGKNYQWFLALVVDGKLTPSTPYVDGWVQRILPDPDLAKTLADPDPLKRATALGAKGVWYDCVATLASLYASQPSNRSLANNWSELLVSVGLQDIQNAPLVLSAR